MSKCAARACVRDSGLGRTRKLDGVVLPVPEKVLVEIEELLEQLKEFASGGVPILVEGERDIEALKRLEIEGNFQKITGRWTRLNFLERFSGTREVVVLTDFDRTGERLAEFCVKHLKRMGVRPNLDFWEKIRALVRKDVKDIEGLARYFLGQRAAVRGWTPPTT